MSEIKETSAQKRKREQAVQAIVKATVRKLKLEELVRTKDVLKTLADTETDVDTRRSYASSRASDAFHDLFMILREDDQELADVVEDIGKLFYECIFNMKLHTPTGERSTALGTAEASAVESTSEEA